MVKNRNKELYNFTTPDILGNIVEMFGNKPMYDAFLSNMYQMYKSFNSGMMVTDNEDGNKVIDSDIDNDELENAITMVCMLKTGVSQIDWNDIASINKCYTKNNNIINKYLKIQEELKYLNSLGV